MNEKFNFKKYYGQNFINDNNIIENMIKYASLDSETLTIEIGPGAGILSSKIIPKSKFSILYEIDKELEPILIKKLSNYDNYKLIISDFLKEDVKKEIEKYDYKKINVIANLPYYITTPIIEKVTNEIYPDKMIIMIQKEVADRLCASIKTKEYGYITAYLNYFYDIKKLFNVSRNCFTPKPNVDSTIISLNKKKRNNEVIDLEFLIKLLKDSFRYKRKNLKNNLKNYDLEIVSNVLSKYNMDLTLRAESLSIEIFIELANELLKK